MKRREFLETVAAAAVVPALAPQEPTNEWGSPVVDLHFHLRPQPAANLAHLDGVGITMANLLTRAGTLHGGLDGGGTQLWRGEAFQFALETAHGYESRNHAHFVFIITSSPMLAYKSAGLAPFCMHRMAQRPPSGFHPAAALANR